MKTPAAFLFSAALCVCNALAGPAPQPVPLRAGAAASNITPQLGVSLNGGMQDSIAATVHDELHARCLVLDDGRTKLAIVVCDSCMIPREVFDAAKARIEKEVGIPVAHQLMSATHTHSAPTSASVFQSDADASYKQFLIGRIVDGVKRAHAQLRPAQIGWGRALEPEQVFNRRWHMKPNVENKNPFGGIDQVRMNPGVKNPDLLKPAGPTDPEIRFITLRGTNGAPLGLLANYSLHYVGGVAGVSADYFGAFADRIQQLLGADRLDPPFVGILSNGTSADINNINWKEGGQPNPGPYGRIRIVADAVAQKVHTAHRDVPFHAHVRLAAKQVELTLKVRKPTAVELATAREIVSRTKTFPRMSTQQEIYARETVQMHEYPDEVRAIVQVLRIGDLAIAAIPCETFVEIGLELKAKSPIKPLFTISLANGYNGYLPTPEQHKLAGYETWRAKSSYLETGASVKITGALLALLEELK